MKALIVFVISLVAFSSACAQPSEQTRRLTIDELRNGSLTADSSHVSDSTMNMDRNKKLYRLGRTVVLTTFTGTKLEGKAKAIDSAGIVLSSTWLDLRYERKEIDQVEIKSPASLIRTVVSLGSVVFLGALLVNYIDNLRGIGNPFFESKELSSEWRTFGGVLGMGWIVLFLTDRNNHAQVSADEYWDHMVQKSQPTTTTVGITPGLWLSFGF